VCVLDAAGLCLGCLRTVDEITRWREMSGPEQWRVIDRLAERRAARLSNDGTPPDGGSHET
jgi:uncharacterized protein